MPSKVMKRLRPYIHIAIPFLAILLANCSAPISVHAVKPARPSGATSEKSAACLLDAIRNSESLALSGDKVALDRYNYSIARLIEAIGHLKPDPWDGRAVVSDHCGSYTLRCHALLPHPPGHGISGCNFRNDPIRRLCHPMDQA